MRVVGTIYNLCADDRDEGLRCWLVKHWDGPDSWQHKAAKDWVRDNGHSPPDDWPTTNGGVAVFRELCFANRCTHPGVEGVERLICDGLRMLTGVTVQGRLRGKLYVQLCRAFGYPDAFDEYKVDVWWPLLFEDDGTVATVYNFKTGPAYLGEDAPAVEDIDEWCVGGFGAEAVDLVRGVLGVECG